MTTPSATLSPSDALFTELYEKLHRLAKRELQRNGGVTLGATTLLHDAYLDISGRDGTVFPDLHQFMGYASRVMRGIIIDYARSRQAQKRGGLLEMTSMRTDMPGLVPDARNLTRVSDALDELATTDPRLARIVSEVLLRLLVRRDRGHVGPVRAHGAARLGESPHLPARVPVAYLSSISFTASISAWLIVCPMPG